MSDKSSINAMLARPIRDGSNLCGLLPATSCRSTYLGKGDTYYGIDRIQEWIGKYHRQTRELARKLKGGSLEESVGNIYRFLYDHFQYRADERDQNLRSPSCSCHSREEGIDCKSYSIFAGCLLTNMGISYHIRKIKQPGKTSNQFTHVYIVVPKDQPLGDLKKGYHVIDGTKHSNTEAVFTKKKDVFMGKLPYYGLNGPSGTTTATDDGPLTLPPTNITDGEIRPVPQGAIEGFKGFLDFLREIGVSEKIIAAATDHFEMLASKGINPYFGFLPEGFVIGRKRFRYYIPGVSCHPIASPTMVAAANADEVAVEGMGALRAGGTGNGTIDPGVEIAQIAEDLLKDDFFSNTIGAVFGNGWDLTCWGASNSPKKSEQEVAVDAPALFQLSGLGSGRPITASAVNEFSRLTTIYIKWRTFGAQNGNLASCTRKGNDAGRVAMQGYRDRIISEIKRLFQQAGGSVTVSGTATANGYSVPTSSYFNGNIVPVPGEVTSVEYQTYNVTAPSTVVFTGGGTSSGGSSTGGGSKAKPAGYDSWDSTAKWIYEKKLRDGNTSYYHAYMKNNPRWRGPSSFYTAMGVTPPSSTGTARPSTRPTDLLAKGGTTQRGNPGGTTMAGGNILTMLLLAGAGYGLYKQNQKKRKTTKKSARHEKQ